MTPKPKSVSFVIAERLGEFFLRHALIQQVCLFGSTAMWGEGDDIDLVLETFDRTLALSFLETLGKAWRRLEAENKDIEELYGVLKREREDCVFELLTWQEKRDQCWQICWNGMFQQWDSLCLQKRWVEAQALEDANFHEVDLFLLPVGWQEDEQVDQLLPRWASKRPFGTVNSFRDVLAWQARKFNPGAGTFEKHQPLANVEEEKRFKELQRREHIRWSLAHRTN